MQQLSLCVIGEALIDFIPQEKNCKLKDVMTFKKAAGGLKLDNLWLLL